MNIKSFNNTVICLECFKEPESSELFFTIKQISFSGNKLILKNNSIKMPYLYVTKKGLLINFETTTSSELIYVNLTDNISQSIYSTSFNKTKNGEYTGDIIVYAGGNESTVFFQLMKANKESLEQIHNIDIIEYSINENRVINTFNINRSNLHLTGTQNYLMLSEYAYDRPIMNSGTVYELGNNYLIKRLTIPDIRSGADIIDSFIVNENTIVFQTSKKCYWADIRKSKVYEFNIPSDGLKSSVYLNSDYFTYLEYENNKTIFHKISLALR